MMDKIRHPALEFGRNGRIKNSSRKILNDMGMEWCPAHDTPHPISEFYELRHSCKNAILSRLKTLRPGTIPKSIEYNVARHDLFSPEEMRHFIGPAIKAVKLKRSSNA